MKPVLQGAAIEVDETVEIKKSPPYSTCNTRLYQLHLRAALQHPASSQLTACCRSTTHREFRLQCAAYLCELGDDARHAGFRMLQGAVACTIFQVARGF